MRSYRISRLKTVVVANALQIEAVFTADDLRYVVSLTFDF